MRKLWTQKEISILVQKYPNERTIEIANELGRSIYSVYGMAKNKGLEKSKEFRNNPQKSGRLTGSENYNTRFKKGNVSWNKGKSIEEFLRPETIKKFKANQFKKGSKPHNTLHDNAITTRKSGNKKYKWIRISEGKWIQYHHFIWLQNGREIKKGENITFVDGNTLNCDINNLKKISNSKLMEMNTIQRYPKEVIDMIMLLSKLKKQIHAKEQNS